MQIRPAGPSEIEPALAAMGEAFGYSVAVPSVHSVIADHLLVAIEDGVILGTASTAGFGATGWLGGITVAPAARGRGLGGRLTRAALDVLGPRETVLLLASPLGRPLYDKLGFVAEGAYRVFTSHAQGTHALGAPGEPAEIDRRATGEARAPALRAANALVHGHAVALKPPWRALPILGAPDDAEALLRDRVEPGLRLAAPEANERAVAVMQELGSEREGVVRMRLGPPVPWRPDEVWGVFSLFFG